MEQVSFLLTPEFVEFSKKIGELVEEKKGQEVKYTAIKAKFDEIFKAIEAKAEALQQEWKNWKNSQVNPQTPES